MESTDLKQSSPDASAPATQAPPKPVKVPMPRKKKKWIKRVIVLVVLIAVVVFLLRSCSGGSTALTSGIYLPSTASTQDLVVSVSGTGAIEPLHSYKVTTLVKGEVLEAPFEEGQTVHKGDLLFRIDSTDVETSIEQAQLSLESARLNYQQLLKNQDDSHKNATVEANATGVITKLYVDEGDMVSAGAPIADILDRDNMKLKVPFHSADAAGFYVGQSATVTVDGTMETLPGTIDTIAATDSVGPGGTLVRDITIVVRNPGALTDTSMGTASIGTASSASSGTFAYGESKQVVAKTSGELTSLTVKEGDRVMEDQVMGGFDETDMETQIENAAIQVQNAELTLKNAQDRLEDYSITSTIDGTVIEKNYDVGDTLDTSNASTTGIAYPAVIYDMSALTFDISVNELDINKIQVGQQVEITADAVEGETFTGVVDKVNINGTTTNGSTNYPVTVLVDGTPEELKPGMNVSAKIIVEDAGSVLCVPVEAVSRGADGTSLVKVAGEGALDENGNLVDSSKLEDRVVTLGRSDDTYIEILSGLEDGETVYIYQAAGTNFMATMMG
ncbi:efflux RND transporter periplasmic adaptor subunit [Intestinimonas aquisgranensis]|uniref:efflux RND transporter periplasmic adaptor subunit n=1 Tax=Intestinimonas timonensis TaxID=1689270 RepID=UPI001D0E84C3|nr:efflux RND transporter periplasmic adaptor subunit [Intestinimonas timonensis]MCC2258108.1 efflux RND transporter periplasmic adaptor subunit [Intestinimonas aquisgranensis]